MRDIPMIKCKDFLSSAFGSVILQCVSGGYRHLNYTFHIVECNYVYLITVFGNEFSCRI